MGAIQQVLGSFAVSVAGPVAYIGGTKAAGGASSAAGPSPAVNTSGSSLLIMIGASYDGLGQGAMTPTDSKGNTWQSGTAYISADLNRRVQCFYVKNPTVGSGHTFTGTPA